MKRGGVKMKAEIVKVVTKKVLMNILILLVIVFLVIAVTGIPLDFDIVSFNGKSTPNMEMGEIIENIKNNTAGVIIKIEIPTSKDLHFEK